MAVHIIEITIAIGGDLAKKEVTRLLERWPD